MLICLCFLILFLVIIYTNGTRTFNYWNKRGIKYESPIPFFGTTFRVTFGIISINEYLAEIYNKYPNEKVVGVFFDTRPSLLIRDPDIAKQVLVTNFANFSSRGFNIQKDVIEPMMRCLFFADGDLWKLLRQRMTPAFSSKKLKAMFPLIVERAEKLQARALEASVTKRTIDARELMARYTTDFIGACGFGLDADSLNQEDSAFMKLGEKIFKPKFKDILIMILKNLFPMVFKHLKMYERFEHDIIKLVNEILIERKYKPSGRNDFMDLLLECRQKGLIIGESIEKKNSDGSAMTVSIELDDILIAAQAFIFFAAGFETSSSSTSNTLHQLAFNQEIQKKVQSEVDWVLAKHNNKLSYDAIKEMDYLECAFMEGMRMLPTVGCLLRECVNDIEIPELGITLEAGTHLTVSLLALQKDSRYFDNPEDFQPERFAKDKHGCNEKFAFMPFGAGPRACIGERLGIMQSLAGLAAILSRFTVKPAPTSQRYPAVDPRGGIVQIVKDGIPLIFEEREKAD